MKQECFVECQWFGDSRVLYEVIRVLEPLCRQDSCNQIDKFGVPSHTYPYRIIFKMLIFPELEKKMLSSQNCSNESLEWNCMSFSAVLIEKLSQIGRESFGFSSSDPWLKVRCWNSPDQTLQHILEEVVMEGA